MYFLCKDVFLLEVVDMLGIQLIFLLGNLSIVEKMLGRDMNIFWIVSRISQRNIS